MAAARIDPDWVEHPHVRTSEASTRQGVLAGGQARNLCVIASKCIVPHPLLLAKGGNWKCRGN
jgi:hypothetical protein